MTNVCYICVVCASFLSLAFLYVDIALMKSRDLTDLT